MKAGESVGAIVATDETATAPVPLIGEQVALPLCQQKEQAVETILKDSNPALPQTVIVEDKGHGKRDDSAWDRTILREQAAGFRVEESHAVAAAVAAKVTDARGDGHAAAAALAAAHTNERIVDKVHEVEINVDKNAAALGVQIADVSNRAAVQATANFNLLTVQGNEMKYTILLDAQKNAAAAELTARTLAASAAAQLAECCCELREEAAKTRALILEVETRGVRDQLNMARGSLAAFFTAGKAPVSPTV